MFDRLKDDFGTKRRERVVRLDVPLRAFDPGASPARRGGGLPGQPGGMAGVGGGGVAPPPTGVGGREAGDGARRVARRAGLEARQAGYDAEVGPRRGVASDRA